MLAVDRRRTATFGRIGGDAAEGGGGGDKLKLEAWVTFLLQGERGTTWISWGWRLRGAAGMEGVLRGDVRRREVGGGGGDVGGWGRGTRVLLVVFVWRADSVE